MNLYEAILEAAAMRRRARLVEEAEGRRKRRESFLRSVPKDAGDCEVHDLLDFQDQTVRQSRAGTDFTAIKKR